MSELEDAEAKIASWLLPLADESQPCGPDLEYDNEFLALTQAVTGKPESQFGPAEPPEWRKAVEIAERLFDRTRDLRVALQWVRGMLHLQGYGAMVVGLKLMNGLLEVHWECIHPQPDPDDQDPYGRVNALTLLREQAGLLGDLRDTRIVDDRAIGVLWVRDVEAALGLAAASPGRAEMSKEQVTRLIEAALLKTPALREHCREAVQQLRALMSQMNDRLGNEAPDLRPLYTTLNGIAGLLPAEGGPVAESDSDEVGEAGEADHGAARGVGRSPGLSGGVNSREEALQAIGLVIEYLERAEPTNPAPLFLRRARQLVGQNFLQLMKSLAPEALSAVARTVGVDPDTVEDPDSGY
jgi:type VI secretion system protein ImpA